MSTPVTFSVDFTREALERLHAELGALLNLGGPILQAASASAPSAPNGALDPLATQLKGRLSPAIQRLVRQIVDNHVGHEFTWETIAKEMKVQPGSVKSWHRSLSKPLNRIGKANPAAPWFLKNRWDGLKNNYTVSPEWAEAIIRTW
jgi:hypothetical protein